MLTTSFSVHLALQGTRILKIAHNLQEQLQATVNCENALIEKEQALNKIIRDTPDGQHGYYAFVPDHLGFECDTGVMIFKVEAPPLVSFWQMRLQ